ncbi:hypothetical protein SJDPG2_08055 [Porphyromonas gingivalis SJD2]|nr:hypothetical protein A343_1403 [Porphyromonas gingivalis JCVI SC001]ERJ67692.1 hypothetical protein HMPREF1554_00881 [Porphyromonas gingivalis F0569]ERJ87239.1 hypothetical protein HMPREF1989_00737 [Porphyromonas gingivalis F0566]ETA26294.1 hypothetical protein SJDPG2_08055 [Porphyromonas gingivalis SJD2]OWR78610.1 hypothetical protein SJDPG5_04720 [Porphyromonas gingivalis SJD5]OWR78653.1 hypothetical protein SJDPG4_05225 [Porphyromonas gingivalis SJD4]OWR81077.1 hypothetical protein SJDP
MSFYSDIFQFGKGSNITAENPLKRSADCQMEVGKSFYFL